MTMTRIEIASGTNLAKLTSVAKFFVVGCAMSRKFSSNFLPVLPFTVNVGVTLVVVVVVVVVVGDTTWT